MPNNCSVFGYSNTRRKTKDLGVKYFRFPKEKSLRDKWINACRRSDPINPQHAVICSIHFDSCDIADDMKARLLT